MSNDPQTIAEVKEFFEEFVEAYPKDDIDRYLALWAKDSNLVVYGTGEKWVGYEEEYKYAPAKEKERFDEISLSFDWTKINSHGSIAWIAADVTVNLRIGEQRIVSPARLTGVVKKSEGKWAIIQGHISIAPPQ
ncbi:MAG: nuclear transport factor 2 family protein [Asgard group archaeon]|nr:nuclear transport factor 2 family protein [Asgard group archaeon]